MPEPASRTSACGRFDGGAEKGSQGGLATRETKTIRIKIGETGHPRYQGRAGGEIDSHKKAKINNK